MSETIVVEAISDKYKNKYNSGSVLAGGKWLQVASKLDLAKFQKDTEMTVETKTNDKGYTSIIGIVEGEAKPVEAVAKVRKASKTATEGISTGPKVSYEDAKSRKILVQGVTQAVVQSPMLAGMPFTTPSEAVALVKEVSLALIAFVDEESR